MAELQHCTSGTANQVCTECVRMLFVIGDSWTALPKVHCYINKARVCWELTHAGVPIALGKTSAEQMNYLGVVFLCAGNC